MATIAVKVPDTNQPAKKPGLYGAPKNGQPPAPQSLVRVADTVQKSILGKLKDRNRQELWNNRGYEPFEGDKPVDFPSFQKLGQEIKNLKTRLAAQAEAAGGALDLRTRGEISKAGMYLQTPDGSFAAVPKTTTDRLTTHDIPKLITKRLMAPYYEKVEKGQPVPHDTTHLKQDFWLPGLFVIDEIFQALVNDTWNKCVAYNQAADEAARQAAWNDLEAFVKTIAAGKKGRNDGDKYLPFINYAGKARGKTHITLVTDKAKPKTVVGAVVHVHDWASGTHSNGKGMP